MKNKKRDTTSKTRQQTRRAKLNAIAQAAGFTGWSAYETACIKAGKL